MKKILLLLMCGLILILEGCAVYVPHHHGWHGDHGGGHHYGYRGRR